MALPTQGGFNEHMDKGIIISEVAIAGVEDVSGLQLPFMTRPCDLGVKIFLDIGKSFQPEMSFVGDFNKAPDGSVKDWGKAFIVREFINRVGVGPDWLTEDNHFKEGVLAQLVNKTFLRLSYVTGRRTDGRLKYSDWVQIANPKEGAGKLMDRFQASVSKGYPKNYAPNTLDEVAGAPSFP